MVVNKAKQNKKQKSSLVQTKTVDCLLTLHAHCGLGYSITHYHLGISALFQHRLPQSQRLGKKRQWEFI